MVVFVTQLVVSSVACAENCFDFISADQSNKNDKNSEWIRWSLRSVQRETRCDDENSERNDWRWVNYQIRTNKSTHSPCILVGYRNVAIEQIFEHENVNSKIPSPVDLSKLKEKTQGRLNLFNRLTIVYSDPSVCHSMSRSNELKKFNVIAALPTNDTALQHACQNFIGEIITYNSKTIKFRLNRKFYYLALRRNLFFELKYSPTIIDSTARRLTISRSLQYHLAGRGRGVIISSEAKDRFHVRSPCDVANLGLIFNLSEDQARSAVNLMCRKVLIAAESRRLGKTPLLASYADVDTSTSEEEEDEENPTEHDKEPSKRKNSEHSVNSSQSKQIKKQKLAWSGSLYFIQSI